MNIESLTSGLSGTSIFWGDLAFKSSALLLVTLLAWASVGRRRPSIGSSLAHAGLVGLLLLPASILLFPERSIAILPPEPAVQTSVAVIPERDDILPVDDAETAPADLEKPTIKRTEPERVASIPRQLTGQIASSTAPKWTLNGPQALMGVYATISLLMLLRLAGSLVSVARLRRDVEPVEDPAWLDRLDRLVFEVGITRPVALARSSRVSVPVVVGWRRPMILLPTSLESSDHSDAILLHELTHVRRGDYGWNLILRVVEALYWPHPLVWLLARAVTSSRERACDAFCVHRLGGPSAYRAALIAMAERLTRRNPSPALGLAMARSSRLGRRVRAIDRSPGEPRCVPRWPTRFVILGVALLATALVGPARLTTAQAPPQEPKKAVDPIKPPAVGKVFHLKVVGAKTGRPVPKADVRVWMGLGQTYWIKTDNEGKLDINYAKGRSDRHFSVDVWGDGFAMQRHKWGLDPNHSIPEGATIKLQPGESLGGIVQDEAGKPVAGAIVYLWSHNYKHQDPAELLFDLRAITGPDGRWHTGGAPTTTGEIIGFYINHPDFIMDREYIAKREKPPIADLRAGKAVSVLKKGPRIEGRVLDKNGKPVEGAMVISTEHPSLLFGSVDQFLATTDTEGRFKTPQVKSGDWNLLVKAKGNAPAIREVKVGETAPFQEIKLDPPHKFRARVVDPIGRPIEGAFVNIDTWRRFRCLGVYLYTDGNGWVQWDDAPDDRLMLNIDHENHLGLFMTPASADTDLSFTLKPSLAISGIVRDAETRKGIIKAEVEYGAIDPKTGEVPVWIGPPKTGWTWFNSGYLNVRFAAEADHYKIRIKSEGYQNFVSGPLRRDDKVITNYDVNLEPLKADGPVATVVRPDGKPLSGLPVLRISGEERVWLQDGKLEGNDGGRPIVTKADGSFPIPQNDGPTIVLILADDCYAVAMADTLLKTPKLQARPYGRVEGRYLIGSKPFANEPIELKGRSLIEADRLAGLEESLKTTTDAEGRFVFEKVLPSDVLRIVRSRRQGEPQKYRSIGERVRVEAGRTTLANIGGSGRAVVGRVMPPVGIDRPIDFSKDCSVVLESNQPYSPLPLELVRGITSLHDRGWMDWTTTWNKSPEGQEFAARRIMIRVTLEPDGSFRIDDVPTGEYRFQTSINDLSIGKGQGSFTSPLRIVTIPGEPSNAPLDLGSIPLKFRAAYGPKVGEASPNVEVTTVDGKKLNLLDDYRGKYVLIDFGTTWDMQSRLQVIRMNDIFARFGKNDKFAMVSLLAGPDGTESRKFVNEKGEPWPQAIIGDFPNPIAESFGIDARDFPAIILIGPDGKVVARDLVYDKIGEAIAKALGVQEPAKPAPKPRDPNAVDRIN